MTPQEQQMLQGLTDRVNKTQLPDKDLDAEQMLQQTLGRNPDALYILAQTVLVQQYALEQAQKQLADARGQIDQLRQQAGPPVQQKHSTSFLGNLLGLKEDEPVRPAPPPPPVAPPQAQYAPVPGYAAAPGYAAPGYGQGAYGAPAQGGFLRSALQTATGVAAGALAFEGIESLMHGFGHSAGYGSEFGGMGGFGGGSRPEEVINNYYGDSAPGAEHTTYGEHNDFAGGGNDLSASGDDQGTSDTGDAFDSGDGDNSLLADDSSDSGTDDNYSDSGGDFDSGGQDDGSNV